VLLANVLYDAHEQLREQVRAVPDLLRGAGEVPPPALTLDLAPRSVVGPRPGRPLRPVPWSDGVALPGRLVRPLDRPRLLVSRSTLAGPAAGDPTAAVLGSAPAVDADIVLARPPERLRGRALPANVRTVEWLPLEEAMAHCSAVVHHGGAGTVLGALAAGIPQLVVPGLGDRTTNAELVAARGAGLAVPARRITAAVLRRLLTDPALVAAARDVAAEIAAMPAPADVVPDLEALAAGRPLAR
jgi:UDP:flavonoid glycosyltransferase YjiC (YdhE family)